MLFKAATLIIYLSTGQEVSQQPLQYDVEAKVCGSKTAIKSKTTGDTGWAKIVCGR